MGVSLLRARHEVAGKRYIRAFDWQGQVRQTGQRKASTFGWACNASGQPDVRLSCWITTGERRVRQGSPVAGSRIETGQGHRAFAAGEKELWPSASGGLERRKERPCGRFRCLQDDSGRQQRLTGDNVRLLMRLAQRQREGSAGRQYAERNMKGHPGGAPTVRQRRCA